jgi:transposase
VEAELNRYDGVAARLARQHRARCAELNQQIAMLDRELNTLMKDLAPTLLNVPGCGVLSAAVLVGETAGVDRFKSKDTFARFTGTAPIPVWSGSSEGKVRLNRGGNRLTNTALHMIAITQSRGHGPGALTLRSSKPAARPAPRPSACCAAELRPSPRFALTPHIAAPAQQTARSSHPPPPSGPRLDIAASRSSTRDCRGDHLH